MTVRAQDVRLRRGIFECSIAPIVVKDVSRARQPAGAAHHWNALPETSRSLAGRRRGGEIEIHVVGHDQVKLPVAIVIHEGATSAPVFSGTRDPGFFASLREDALTIVVEAILPVVRDVQVFPTIVVVIANADALPPARGTQSGFFRHVGEGPVVVVAIQATSRPFPGGKSIE